MPATEHQKEKFNEVVDLIENQQQKRIRLIGSAGVGKTWLAAELMSYFKRSRACNPNYNNGTLYATAPTNKALGVLQSKIDIPGIYFKTIHSACKLFMNIDRVTGAVKFIRQSYNPKKKDPESFDRCKIALIDEVSMLNSDFLGKTITNEHGQKEYIPGYLDDYNFPIIFIGDSKQLNPVGEEVSPIWLKDWPTVELTEIIRQGEGNPIIDLSRDLDLIYFKSPCIKNGKGYIYNDNKMQLIDELAEVNGTDDLKYLAYTNIDVDAMNRAVRVRRYGENVRRIEKDETIVFNSPHGNFYTSKEVKVDKFSIITDYVYIPSEKTKFSNVDQQPLNDLQKIKMKYYRVNDAFNVVHEDSDLVYKEVYASLKENNKRYTWDGRGYHYFASLFADITYNHALTVHKSQGSTYKEAIINIGNIGFNRNEIEKQRMLYTAVTRASNIVILNNVK